MSPTLVTQGAFRAHGALQAGSCARWLAGISRISWRMLARSVAITHHSTANYRRWRNKTCLPAFVSWMIGFGLVSHVIAKQSLGVIRSFRPGSCFAKMTLIRPLTFLNLLKRGACVPGWKGLW